MAGAGFDKRSVGIAIHAVRVSARAPAVEDIGATSAQSRAYLVICVRIITPFCRPAGVM